MTSVDDLRSRLDGLPAPDVEAFRRRIAGTAKVKDRDRRQRILARIGADIDSSHARVARRLAARPAEMRYPAELPITARRQELLDTIGNNQVVVVAGETGSGKSTQLPKLCLELGRGVSGWIGHTQPRRIAARNVAARVAEETGTELGGLIGYSVRFTDHTSDDTSVRVMTDGLLLAETRNDPMLRRYDTIIVDEAHERSLNIDFLLGHLRRIVEQRTDLKVIITSATIDTAAFSAHFGGAPIVEVSGRSFPVEVRYRPPITEDGDPIDQPEAIARAVTEIAGETTGDILVFCSGEREIRDATDAIAELDLRHTEVVPLFARLSAGEQQRVFAPHTGRRIVIATNVAETSLTVPGIMAVVDPGTARISRYNRRTKVQRLPIEPVSQASADQRAGRCGRIAPGVCIRLYSEEDYESRPRFTEPEVQRTGLAAVILQMAALGLGDVETFPFIDPPDSRAIRDGVAMLEELGALDPGGAGSAAWLTDIGRVMAGLPVDPRLARMLIAADRNGCLREVLVIVSGLSIQDPRERPFERRQRADELHARFSVPGSDLLSWLQLWKYLRDKRKELTSGRFRRMCIDEHLNHRRVREWQDVHAQLREACSEAGMKRNDAAADVDTIHRSILAGLLGHVGMKDPQGHLYRGPRTVRYSINPGSSLFKTSPRWVMAAEVVETSRTWARELATIDPAWIEDVGAHLVSRTYSEPWWDPELGATVARETVNLYGLVVAERTVQYGRIDPETARSLFIHHALVHGEVSGNWDQRHRFVEHNRALLEDLREIEERERRADILVDDETLEAFFDERIPAEITTVRHFERWWRDVRPTDPHLLDYTDADVVSPEVDPLDRGAFPRTWQFGGVEAPLDYTFDPSSHRDGVTVVVEVADLDRVDNTALAWNVPGLRHELIEALVKTLPKEIRRQLIPMAETVEHLVTAVDPSAGTPVDELRRALSARLGHPVPPEAFDPGRLPNHLIPRVRVVADGTTVAESSDLAELQRTVSSERDRLVAETRHPVEATGLTAFPSDLVPTIEVSGGIEAYPSLVDEGSTVGVRVLARRDDQARAMRRGTRRLLALGLERAERIAMAHLDMEARLALVTSPYPDEGSWADDCVLAAVDAALTAHGGPVWDTDSYAVLARGVYDDVAGSIDEAAERSLRIVSGFRDAAISAERWDSPVFDRSIGDIGGHLAQLVYPGFITAVGMERLADVERYVRGIVYRLERLGDDLQRDLQRIERLEDIEAGYDRLVDVLPPSADLTAVGWMIQELRVAVFAQPIGAKGGVSDKKIRQEMRRLEMSG